MRRRCQRGPTPRARRASQGAHRYGGFFAAAGLGFALLGAAAACSSGSGTVIDTSGIVQPVTARLNELGVRVARVECPTGPTVEAGATFSCTIATEGGAPVGLEVTPVPDGQQVKLSWKLGPEVLPTAPLVGDLTGYAHAAISSDLQVTCPKALVAAGGDGVLTCDVRDAAGSTATLEVPVAGGAPVADRAQWSIVQT